MAQDYMGGAQHRKCILGGGDTAHISLLGEQLGWIKKSILGGGHRTYFVEEGNNMGGDTAQH